MQLVPLLPPAPLVDEEALLSMRASCESANDKATTTNDNDSDSDSDSDKATATNDKACISTIFPAIIELLVNMTEQTLIREGALTTNESYAAAVVRQMVRAHKKISRFLKIN